MNLCSRRHWLHSSAFGLAGLASAFLLDQDGLLAEQIGLEKPDLEPKSFDLLPAVLHQFGLDHRRLKYRSGMNDITLADSSGQVVRELLA